MSVTGSYCHEHSMPVGQCFGMHYDDTPSPMVPEPETPEQAHLRLQALHADGGHCEKCDPARKA